MAACAMHDSFVGHSDQVSILNESINFNLPSALHPFPRPPSPHCRQSITVRYLLLGALVTRCSETLQISQYADEDGVMQPVTYCVKVCMWGRVLGHFRCYPNQGPTNFPEM
jgi:hypothetical protein